MTSWTETLQGELTRLAQRRPLFHSEADFQHELAWQLQSQGLVDKVRLELPVHTDKGVMNLDLLAVRGKERVAIELKYWKRALNLTLPDGERFALKNQGAHDISRYDFWKDVWRIETMIDEGQVDAGFALTLTNDPGYWRPGRGGTIDAAFRLHPERAEVSGALAWEKHAGIGTTRGRPDLHIRSSYQLSWHDYSLPDPQHPFRYMMLAVGNKL